MKYRLKFGFGECFHPKIRAASQRKLMCDSKRVSGISRRSLLSGPRGEADAWVRSSSFPLLRWGSPGDNSGPGPPSQHLHRLSRRKAVTGNLWYVLLTTQAMNPLSRLSPEQLQEHPPCWVPWRQRDAAPGLVSQHLSL